MGQRDSNLLFVGTDHGGIALGYRPEGNFPPPEPIYLDGKKGAKDALKEAAMSAIDCSRRRRRLSDQHQVDEASVDGYHELWADTKVGDPHPHHARRLGIVDDILNAAKDVCRKNSLCNAALLSDPVDVWAVTDAVKGLCRGPCKVALDLFCDIADFFVPDDPKDVIGRVITRLCDPNPHCSKGTLVLSKVERVIDYSGPKSDPAYLRVSGLAIFRDVFEDRYLALTRCNVHNPGDGDGCHIEIYTMPWVECIAATLKPDFFPGRDLQLDVPFRGTPPDEEPEGDAPPPSLADLAISGADTIVKEAKKNEKKKAKGKKKAPKKSKKLAKAGKAVGAAKRIKGQVDKFNNKGERR